MRTIINKEMESSMVKTSSLLDAYEIGQAIRLEAAIIDQLFFNEENRYGVYRIENNKDTCLISGYFPYDIKPKQTYRIAGTVSTYKDEKQIKLESIFITLPTSETDVIDHLKEIKGVKKVASLIVERYGLNSIAYCIDYPHEVSNDIKGVSESLAQTISIELQLRFAQIDIREKLKLWGFTAKQSESIAQKLGQTALVVIRKNPYELIDLIHGIGFKTIDKLASQFGFNQLSEVRAIAAIRYCLAESATQGHCYMKRDILISQLLTMLSVQLTPFECASLLAKGNNQKKLKYEHEGATFTIAADKLIQFMNRFDEETDDEKRERMHFTLAGFEEKKINALIDELIEQQRIIIQEDRVYLREYYMAELKFAYKIIQLMLFEGLNFDNGKIIEQALVEGQYKLETKQLEAVRTFTAAEGGFMILNGSAGCGKTFTLNIILDVLERLYKAQNKTIHIHVMAPTGKAAQVASVATKQVATTIHRGLRWQPDGGFQYNEQEPLPCDVLVVDESSMLDIRLAYQLSRAIKNNCKVIFMGDTKQLQSVGAGNVLHDLIATGLVPIVTLDVVKRQGKDSGIIDNARRIINFEMIRSEQAKGDSFVLESNSNTHTLQLLIKGIERLCHTKRFNLADIQVLSPMRKGMLGVDYLNYILQQSFNMPSEEQPSYFNKSVVIEEKKEEKNTKVELNYYVGDKVIHLVNDYAMPWYSYENGQYSPLEKQGITNGECGVIYNIVKLPSITSGEQVRITVKYDEGFVHYINPGAELDHAYALTIHKSQGSQWPAVFMPIGYEQRHMLTNSLIYTGFTRAKQFQCVIGQLQTIKAAIKHDTMEARLTSLKERFVV